MTVQFQKVEGFLHMLPKEAEALVYEKVIPACEKAGVMLLPEGNAVAVTKPSGDYSLERYNKKKLARTLFCISTIKAAYFDIPNTFNSISRFSTKCDPRTVLGKIQRRNFSFGSVVVAMLLQGHKAHFGNNSKDLQFRCRFDAQTTQGAQRVMNALQSAGYGSHLPTHKKQVKSPLLQPKKLRSPERGSLRRVKDTGEKKKCSSLD